MELMIAILLANALGGRYIHWVQVVYWCLKLPVCTAQGGGRSFKDRKPIGGWSLELMDRRANPRMDRQAVGGSAV